MNALRTLRDTPLGMLLLTIAFFFLMVVMLPALYLFSRFGMVRLYAGTADAILRSPVLLIVVLILLVSLGLARVQRMKPFYSRYAFWGSVLTLFVIVSGLTVLSASMGHDLVWTSPGQCSSPCILNSEAYIGSGMTAVWNVNLEAGERVRIQMDIGQEGPGYSYGPFMVEFFTQSRRYLNVYSGNVPGQFTYGWNTVIEATATHTLKINHDDSGLAKLQVMITQT